MVATMALVAAGVMAAGAASMPSAPAKPTALPGNAGARVAWVAPANNGSAITGYILTPFIGSAAKPARTFNSAAVAQTVTGLTNGITYTFKVRARNAAGAGANSVASAAITIGAPAAPARPLVAPGTSRVRLNWVAPANHGTAITGYVVTPFVGAVAQAARTFNSTALAQTITALTNGVTYTFRLAAKNAKGTGPRSLASGAARPTAQPTLKLVMNATIGQPILVNSYGMTVYMFGPDGVGTTSTVHGSLRAAWPYVTWGGTVTAGAGLTLSSATAHVQTDNTRLIGYHSHLLYTFVGDAAPGDVSGQGVNNFFVLDAAGNKIP